MSQGVISPCVLLVLCCDGCLFSVVSCFLLSLFLSLLCGVFSFFPFCCAGVLVVPLALVVSLYSA
jgi:uncharacterized membrane protein